MKNILFSSNLEDYSKYIYQYALQIGQHFNATIHFAHIFEAPTPALLESDLIVNKRFIENIEHWAEDQYKEKISKLKHFAIMETPFQFQELLGDYFVREGNNGDQILEIARKEKIELIVLGMNQQNKLQDRLFGNLSMRIMDKATCPVLLVPPKSTYLGIQEILFASDFHQHDMESLHYLLSWALAFGAKLHFLHIAENYNQHDVSDKKMKKIQDFFEDKVAENLISYKVIEGQAAQKIEEYAATVGADLLVISTHVKGYWERLLEHSMTREVARTINIPVLVLKEEV